MKDYGSSIALYLTRVVYFFFSQFFLDFESTYNDNNIFLNYFFLNMRLKQSIVTFWESHWIRYAQNCLQNLFFMFWEFVRFWRNCLLLLGPSNKYFHKNSFFIISANYEQISKTFSGISRLTRWRGMGKQFLKYVTPFRRSSTLVF